jgi:hypothetical protein
MSNWLATTNLMRVMLMKREVFRVGAGFRGLRIRSGRAWVTLGGRDLTLPRGQMVALDSKAGPAVISSLGQSPLVFELLGDLPPAAESAAG